MTPTSLPYFYKLSKKETGGHTVYGISITEQASDRVRFSVEDVSADRAALIKLIEYCNRNRLSPLHIREVIEDFLSHPELYV